MSSVNITYRISLDEKKIEVFEFDLDEDSFDLLNNDADSPPEWTELGFRQCEHCPLNEEEHTHCPVALAMYPIVERFHETRSIDEVEMEVITDERRVIQTTELQRAIASMFDLVFPVCGCPKTEHMKPLSRFHLPLASEEETVFRTTSMYLLAQYFLKTSAKHATIDFRGLTDIYNDLHILNTAVASRLRGATMSDSVKNAVTLLDMYSTLVPLLLEDELVEMRNFFNAYLPEEEVESAPVPTNNYLEKAKAFSLELEPMVGDDAVSDDVPDWLKEEEEAVAAEDSTEEKPQKMESEEESAIDKLLSNSSLSLSLEPMDGDQPAADTAEQGGGPSVFKLPDEE